MKIVLASQSPGRKDVLEKAGFIFDIIPSTFEEDMTLPFPPHELAMHLSLGKARDITSKVDDAIIIAADTFGVYENNLLGKPHTKERAKEMLQMLRGRVHSMVTGITVIDTVHNKEITQSDETKIWFRDISDKEIEEYIDSGESLQKAGGYKYQGIGRKFVQKVEGSETNIMGLPIEKLLEILKEFNYTR